MIRLLSPAGAPPWLLPFKQSVERAFNEPHIDEFASTGLPDPLEGRGKIIIVTDLNAGVGMTAFSNGTSWVRTDNGATL